MNKMIITQLFYFSMWKHRSNCFRNFLPSNMFRENNNIFNVKYPIENTSKNIIDLLVWTNKKKQHYAQLFYASIAHDSKFLASINLLPNGRSADARKAGGEKNAENPAKKCVFSRGKHRSVDKAPAPRRKHRVGRALRSNRALFVYLSAGCPFNTASPARKEQIGKPLRG